MTYPVQETLPFEDLPEIPPTSPRCQRWRHGAHRFVFRLGRTRREREEIELGLPTRRPYPKQPDPEPSPARTTAAPSAR
ncbi:hypothetical protein GCM10010278_69130 [Streptomyces melanogenes]|nr:hypothetical protein GCM10010278_69130 [Streptomyces melanogenes]